MTADPYVDPDTGVLANLLGLTTAAHLERAEADLVALSTVELEVTPVLGLYDVAHLQAFHRRLFGDVYPWAGDFRTVNIARTASFGDWRHIRTYLDVVFADLATENHLRDLAVDELVPRLTHYFAEVNAAHPFRDGNGRTQRAFFRQMLRESGWSIRWSKTTAAEIYRASESSLMGNNEPLAVLLRRCVGPL